jgi:uncharacterized membrane protein
MANLSWKYIFAVSLLLPLLYVGALIYFLVGMILYVPNFGEINISINGFNTIIGVIFTVFWFSMNGALIGFSYFKWKREA